MITLAFLFLFCICILCCFLTQKSTLSDAFFGVFWIRYGAIFWCFADSPVLLDGGSSSGGGQICQNAEIPPSFMSLPPVFSVNACIYSTLRPFLCNTGGFAPNPSLTQAPQGRRLKPNHLTLWRSVGSAPRRQG